MKAYFPSSSLRAIAEPDNENENNCYCIKLAYGNVTFQMCEIVSKLYTLTKKDAKNKQSFPKDIDHFEWSTSGFGLFLYTKFFLAKRSIIFKMCFYSKLAACNYYLKCAQYIQQE